MTTQDTQGNGQGPGIPPMAVPTSFSWKPLRDNAGNPWILLSVFTPVGQQTYWLPIQNAKELSAGLEQAAKSAGAQLIVPQMDQETLRDIGRTALGETDPKKN